MLILNPSQAESYFVNLSGSSYLLGDEVRKAWLRSLFIMRNLKLLQTLEFRDIQLLGHLSASLPKLDKRQCSLAQNMDWWKETLSQKKRKWNSFDAEGFLPEGGSGCIVSVQDLWVISLCVWPQPLEVLIVCSFSTVSFSWPNYHPSKHLLREAFLGSPGPLVIPCSESAFNSREFGCSPNPSLEISFISFVGGME